MFCVTVGLASIQVNEMYNRILGYVIFCAYKFKSLKWPLTLTTETVGGLQN